jgi:hypothetical protein
MRFAIKDAGNLVFINKATGVPAFYSEDANSFEFKYSAESVYAKAKGNKAIAFEGETTCELKVEYEVIQFAQLSVMMASDVVDANNHELSRTFKGRLDGSKKITIKNAKPVEGSISVFKLAPDGQEFEQKYEAKLQQQAKDAEITVSTEGAKAKDMVIVFYMEAMPKIKTITMKDNGESPNFRIEADVAARTQDGKNMAMHMSIKNAKAKKNAELTLSAENPSKFPMEFDCFTDENGEYAVLSYIGDGNASPASMLEALDPSNSIALK